MKIKNTNLSKIPRQLSFMKNPIEFGGSLLQGKRKEARPISTKTPMHVILKSEQAKGLCSFINHRSALEVALSKISEKFRVRIYDKSVNNNHIHIIARFKTRADYKAWIRMLAAEIVRIIARRMKKPLKNFFTFRPYTKIISWGRQFEAGLNYIILNQMEYFGLRPKKLKKMVKNKNRLGVSNGSHL